MRISRYVFLSSSEGQDDQSRHLPSDRKVRFSPASTASRCPIAATANPPLSTPLPPSPHQHLLCMWLSLRTQEWKSHLLRTQGLKVLPLNSGVGQSVATCATLSARDFFLANSYPSGPFTCIFSKTSPKFLPVLATANAGFCVGPQNKIGSLTGCRFPRWVPAEYK